MSEPEAKRVRVRPPLAEIVGWALWIVALVWWYFYYSQYGGSLYLFEQKFVCVAVATDTCLDIQQKLMHSAIPGYHPVFFWAGVLFLALGFLQRRSRRR
jgi:hypothetical protein